MKLLKISLLSLFAASLLFTVGCDDDDDANPVTVTAITAAGTDLETGDPTTVDLNGASAAENVPLDAVITITFVKAVDASSVNSSSVSLTQGGAPVPSMVTVSGSAVTVNPDEDFDRGTNYVLSLSNAIKADDGGSFSAIQRSFKSAGRAGIVPPQDANQLAYFNFDNNVNSEVGGFTGVETGVSFDTDRFGQVESAARFDGDISIVEVANGDQLFTPSWTLSYWMKIDSNNHVGGHFVAGLGDVYGFFIEIGGGLGTYKFTANYSRSDGTVGANDFFFNGDGMDASNGGWEGIAYERDLSPDGLAGLIADEWVHVVITYNAATNRRSLYINGLEMETDDLSVPAGTSIFTGLTFDDSNSGTDIVGNKLAFGFNHDKESTHWNDTPWGDYNKPDANHFKGWLDDARIFDVAFTAEDVTTLYNAEK